MSQATMIRTTEKSKYLIRLIALRWVLTQTRIRDCKNGLLSPCHSGVLKFTRPILAQDVKKTKEPTRVGFLERMLHALTTFYHIPLVFHTKRVPRHGLTQ